MEKALAIRQLINNLRDLAPIPTEWPETLPLLRDSARQLGFPSDVSLPTMRAVARLWLHTQGGYGTGEDTTSLMSRVRALLRTISLREQQQPYSVALAGEEIAHQLGLTQEEADAHIRQVLDSDDEFLCDAQRTQFTYIQPD